MNKAVSGWEAASNRWRNALQMIDHAREATGAEAVVDIHHADVGSATVQHGQQRRQPGEAGAITRAGRHGDDRHADQARHHAWQSSLHPGDADDHARSLELLAMPEEPMQPGHADIVDGLGAVAHHFRGQAGLLGDRDIAGAGREGQNQPLARARMAAPDGNRPRKRMEFRLAAQPPYGTIDAFAGARNQDVVLGSPRAQHSADNPGDLLRSLARGEDGLGKTLAQRAVVVNLGEAEVFKRQVAQPLDGLRDRKAPGSHPVKEPPNVWLFHLAPEWISRSVSLLPEGGVQRALPVAFQVQSHVAEPERFDALEESARHFKMQRSWQLRRRNLDPRQVLVGADAELLEPQLPQDVFGSFDAGQILHRYGRSIRYARGQA